MIQQNILTSNTIPIKKSNPIDLSQFERKSNININRQYNPFGNFFKSPRQVNMNCLNCDLFKGLKFVTSSQIKQPQLMKETQRGKEEINYLLQGATPSEELRSIDFTAMKMKHRKVAEEMFQQFISGSTGSSSGTGSGSGSGTGSGSGSGSSSGTGSGSISGTGIGSTSTGSTSTGTGTGTGSTSTGTGIGSTSTGSTSTGSTSSVAIAGATVGTSPPTPPSTPPSVVPVKPIALVTPIVDGKSKSETVSPKKVSTIKEAKKEAEQVNTSISEAKDDTKDDMDKDLDKMKDELHRHESDGDKQIRRENVRKNLKTLNSTQPAGETSGEFAAKMLKAKTDLIKNLNNAYRVLYGSNYDNLEKDMRLLNDDTITSKNKDKWPEKIRALGRCLNLLGVENSSGFGRITKYDTFRERYDETIKTNFTKIVSQYNLRSTSATRQRPVVPLIERSGDMSTLNQSSSNQSSSKPLTYAKIAGQTPGKP